MIRLFVLLIIVYIYFNIYAIIDFDKIDSENDFNFLLYCIMILLLYLYVHIRFDITKLYRVITPFFLYSFFFWWLSFYLLFLFSSYRVDHLIYNISILSFTCIIIFYEMFSLLIPNISQYRFIKRLSLARNDYFANKQFYETFWKVCFVLSFLFTSLFFIKAGNIPMLASNPEIARVEAMKGSGIIQRFSYLTLHFGVITYFIIEYFKGHKHINKKILILIIALVFYNILTGPRSYALWTFILIYIVYQLLNYKKLKILHGILLLIFILTLIAVIGGVRYSGLSDVNFSDTIIRFVNRIYMNPVNANRIVEFFYNKPIETNSFLIEISVLLPGYQPDLGTYLKNLFGITFEGGGITVPLPAEGYMNFGYIGVVLYSFIFVLVLKLFELFIYIFRASVFNILFIILIPIQFMGVITMGLSGILVKTTIPVIIVFLTVLTVVKFIINIRKKYSIKVKYDVKTIK